MDLEIKYRGKVATREDIEFIRKLISENPDASRRALSLKLCQAWKWVQPNGVLRDMVCRGFMLHLEAAGLIELPPRRFRPHNPLASRTNPTKVEIDRRPVSMRVSEIQSLDIRQVRRSPLERVFNSLIHQYHYLGYCQPVGEHLKYMVFVDGAPVACFAWSSAPRHIGCRDRFIGWPPAVRKKNLHLIAYNSRFLILPWVRIRCLASHLLGRMSKLVPVDWERMYHHPVYFFETFVDTERFKGTCYYAANWMHLGQTTGRGKDDQTGKPNRSLKAVLGYPLSKDFRRLLHNG
jgi:hypothetical protein